MAHVPGRGSSLVAILDGSGSRACGQAAPGLRLSRAQTGRRYLVFVRAGRESWHRRMMLEDPDRNWDCCVNWYEAPEQEQLAEYYCGAVDSTSNNKLEGFLEFWERRPQPWNYRYIALLDDDVYLRPGELSHFFRLCDFHSLYLSQPALRWRTHTTLNSLVRNPMCLLRRVAFIEAMAPCFSNAALENLIHTFRWTRSVWGIDWAWGALLEGHEPLYVVDAVPMEHTRTGNGRPTTFYRKLRAAGVDPGDDLRRVQKMFPAYAGPRTLSKGHVLRPGFSGRWALGLMFLFERLKFIVRARKKFLRAWRYWRARLEDLGGD
jgi:hypothetical protein